MWEEENAAPVDAERRDIGDQKSQGVDPPAPPMDGRTFRSQQNQNADGKGSEARDEMRPSEREQVEVVPPLKSASHAALAGAGQLWPSIEHVWVDSYRTTKRGADRCCAN